MMWQNSFKVVTYTDFFFCILKKRQKRVDFKNVQASKCVKSESKKLFKLYNLPTGLNKFIDKK